MQTSIAAPTAVTRRDYFALVITQTLINAPVVMDKPQVAAIAVEMADVLLDALSKPPKK